MDTQNSIVLSGYYGFDNTGDEAVLYAIILAVQEQLPNSRLTVLSNNPEDTSKRYGVEAIDRWDIKEVRKAIKASDLLISGGGSLIQDVTSNKNIPYYLGIVKMADFYKKPVVFYSQGIGPVNKGINQMLFKMGTKKVKHIFVREQGSQKTLQSMGVKVPVTVAIDPVLGLTYDERLYNKVKNILPQGKNIGIYIRPWEGDSHLLEELAKALEPMISDGYNLHAIPMFYKQDLEIAKALKKKLNGKVEIVERALTVDETIAYTAAFDMVIGMRLHSLIMAAAVATPMIAISYDPKVNDFAKELQLPYCFDVKDIHHDTLTSAMEQLMNDQAKECERLASCNKYYKEKAYLPAQYIKKLLK